MIYSCILLNAVEKSSFFSYTTISLNSRSCISSVDASSSPLLIFSNAQKELTEAVNQKSTEGMLLLGMVYRAQGDTSNARSMYQQYVSADDSEPAKGYNGLALCDMDDGSYDSALE